VALVLVCLILLSTKAFSAEVFQSSSPAPLAVPQQTFKAVPFDVTVTLALVVDKDGNPSHIRVKRSGGSPWDQRAIEAAQKYHFPPPVHNGKPVKVDLTLNVNFKSTDNPNEAPKADIAVKATPK
jgi:TonB family protein